MIIYKIDRDTTTAGGYFTFEENILNKNLREIEDLLGFERSRLQEGADFYILTPPTQTNQFEVLGSTVFPGERFRASPLGQRVNSDDARMKALSKFRRKRLVKVFPLQAHPDAFYQHLKQLPPAELKYFDQVSSMGGNPSAYIEQQSKRYGEKHFVVQRMREILETRNDIFQQLLDEMYPSATGWGVPQFNALVPLSGHFYCRMTGYPGDTFRR
ncbi:MAG: hypothetical protein AAF828_08200 [Bacteroidota bacterium]